MKDLLNMDTVIGVIVIGYGLYLIYRSASQLMKNIRLRKDYKEKHKDYEEVNVYAIYVGLAAVMFVIGIFFAIDPHVEKNEFYYRLTYTMVAMIAVAMGMDTIVKRRIIFDTTGFVYETAYYRYRNVIAVHKNKGIMKNMEIKTMEEDKIAVSRKMGEIFDQHYTAWKQRKKKKK